MYQGDSLFTLSGPEQFGLILLSATLWIGSLWFSRRLGKKRSPLRKVVITLGLFWLFLWLSPQIYYTYYLAIFPELPLQSVVKTPPSPLRVLRILTFTEGFTLSAHSQAIMGWCLIASALLRTPQCSELTKV